MWYRLKLWLVMRLASDLIVPRLIGHCSYCFDPLTTDVPLWIVNRSGFSNRGRRLAYACGTCGPRRKVMKRQVKFYAGGV